MRTTVRLSESLMRDAKAEATRRGETVTTLIERGLRLVLASDRTTAPRTRIILPVSPAEGEEAHGTLPGVDLDDTSALLDIMDGIPHK